MAIIWLLQQLLSQLCPRAKIQTRLKGQYNGKWPFSLVYMLKPLITPIRAIGRHFAFSGQTTQDMQFWSQYDFHTPHSTPWRSPFGIVSFKVSARCKRCDFFFNVTLPTLFFSCSQTTDEEEYPRDVWLALATFVGRFEPSFIFHLPSIVKVIWLYACLH